MNNLKNFYKNKVIPLMIDHFKYHSSMEVPCIKKITINMGVGSCVNNKKLLYNAVSDLTMISGQKPLITKAKKSISNFKLRKGTPIGCMVTLRGNRMWNFWEKLISIAIPRIRDFRGLPIKSFDGRGNYSIGIREQIIFPEIYYDKIDVIRGMDITITTSASSNEEGYFLLKSFNLPFKKVTT